MIKRNPAMVRRGFIPATEAAALLGKSLSTLHRMARDERVVSQRDGAALYVSLTSLREHYLTEGNDVIADIVADHMRSLAAARELDTSQVSVPRAKRRTA